MIYLNQGENNEAAAICSRNKVSLCAFPNFPFNSKPVVESEFVFEHAESSTIGNARFNKYLTPDLEWTCSLLNVHLW